MSTPFNPRAHLIGVTVRLFGPFGDDYTRLALDPLLLQPRAAARSAQARIATRHVCPSFEPTNRTAPRSTTPEEWTQPQWLQYVCHQDAPWLTERMRRRVQDFARVLSCRFPTAQNYRTPRWGKSLLRALSGWRYDRERYDNPRELALARRLIPLREPQKESL